MNSEATIPVDFDLELLEAQGGNISSHHFGELFLQLKKSGSLNHASQQALTATLGELDIVYVVLRKGFIYEQNDDFPEYTCVMKNAMDYWLAGFGCLRVSRTATGGGNTAEMVVSLLPRAQKFGCGRFLVHKLVQYAFGTFRGNIHRVSAPIVCPIQPHYTAAQRKRVLLNTKQLCWVFEKFGFKFEGVSRGAVEGPAGVEGGEPVWQDVHRMSMLNTDYLEGGRSYILSNTRAFQEGTTQSTAETTPWESMIRRQEEEKRDLESWVEEPVKVAQADDACDGEGQSDDESDDDTVLGGDDSDWEVPDDFED